MASPSSSMDVDESKREKQGDITFRFCRECSNMLYPKEDPDSRTLQFACRTCQYSETAEGTCVYRNYLSNTAGETAGVTQDVGSDPTVGLPLCLLCGTVVRCRNAAPQQEDVAGASPQDSMWEGVANMTTSTGSMVRSRRIAR